VGRDRSSGCCSDATNPGVPAEPGSRPVSADPSVAELVSHLYVCHGLSTYRIAGMLGIDRQRVGRLLAKAGVPVNLAARVADG
jgi:hypothetical protein